MVKVCLAHERAITPISDPIHGRIEINLFEREFIDSPFFQRLHFVLQNSILYTTFPANKNTRFPHSLGVAHICGKLFSNGLRKSRYRTLHAFLNNAAELIEDLYLEICPLGNGVAKSKTEAHFQSLKDAHLQTISGLSEFVHSPIFPDADANGENLRVHTEKPYGKKSGLSAIFIVDTLWQAIRLYGLMHDVGHLPMSHAFETAMKKQVHLMNSYGLASEPKSQFEKLFTDRKQEFTSFLDENNAIEGNDEESRDIYAKFFAKILCCDVNSITNVAFDKDFHEIRGLSIFNRYIGSYESTFPGKKGEISNYANLIHHLTLCIFFASALSEDELSKGNRGFLLAIKSLVDGDLDGDRMDYTIRDGHESGSHIGNFDLSRVTSNSLLVMTPENESNRFMFSYYIRALSGIEQFFEQRFQSYKYIIYHRTAHRANSCLERLISQILLLSFLDSGGNICKLVSQFGYLKLVDGNIKSILPDDDRDIFRIDDANLRTLFLQVYELLENIEQPEEQEIFENSADLVKKDILNLIRIVVFRDYSNVIDPLKKQNPIEFLSKNGFDDNRKGRRTIRFVRKLIRESEEHVLAIQKLLNEAAISGKIRPASIIVNHVKQKIFDAAKNQNESWEKQLSIVRENGKVARIGELSKMLDTMKKRTKAESYSKFYIVSGNVKFDKKQELSITKIINEYLKEKFSKYMKECDKRGMENV